MRRSDGVFAYQLAVVVDDARMGINEVVRGCDLLGSTPRQLWLQEELGYPHPSYYHLPLLTGADGRRLAKRNFDLDLAALREDYTPEALIGKLAFLAGLLDREEPVKLSDLVEKFDWKLVKKDNILLK